MPVYRQPVMTYRLDEVIQAFDLPRPNHLKIDVDGAELGVLQGAPATLRDPGLRSVMIESPLACFDAVTQLLDADAAQVDKRIVPPTKSGPPRVNYGLFARS